MAIETKRQIGRLLAIFSCPYPSNICTKLESYCFSGFGGVVIKKKKQKKKNPKKPNMVHITSLLMKKMQFNNFSILCL